MTVSCGFLDCSWSGRILIRGCHLPFSTSQGRKELASDNLAPKLGNVNFYAFGRMMWVDGKFKHVQTSESWHGRKKTEISSKLAQGAMDQRWFSLQRMILPGHRRFGKQVKTHRNIWNILHPIESMRIPQIGDMFCIVRHMPAMPRLY